MKALSVQQPWAYLIVHGVKDVENRTWKTAYRGPVYIHASQRVDRAAMSEMAAWLAEGGDVLDLSAFPTGAIVGKATLTACVTSHASEWFEGPYGWVFTKPIAFRVPIPVKGKLGLWEYR